MTSHTNTYLHEDDLEYLVRLFLSRELRIPIKRISLDADLEADLGVAGDDSEDLIEQFAETFHVQIDDVDLSKYFGPEVGGLLSMFLTRKRIPLTVRHLVRIAQHRHWIDP